MDDDADDVHVPELSLVLDVPLDVAAGLAAADAPGELVDVALDAPALAAAEPLAAGLAALDADAPADPLARGDELAKDDADGLAADVPTAAGEPLALGVDPVGPHAIAKKRAAVADVAMAVLLMRARRAQNMPRA